MIVAGIGCRKDVTEAEVRAAIDAALAAHGLDAEALAGLAVAEQKSDEPGIHAAAQALGLVVLVIARSALERAAPYALSRSTASLRATGLPSASETAAFAAIGPRAKLLGPRIALGPVTCALAAEGEVA